jgi:TusA-related sulfurtransferase
MLGVFKEAMTEQLSNDIAAARICDGGNLDCGSGLLLIIRKAMSEVPQGEVLEIRSTEISVCEDLPAWCRLTENPFLGWREVGEYSKYFVRRGSATKDERAELERAKSYKWQCRVRWQGGMATKVYARNHSWEVGQPASFDVKDVAPSAVEYLLGALGSALAMGFQIEASRRGVAVEEIEISLHGQLDNIFVFLGLETDGHSGFRTIDGTMYVRSEAEEETLLDIWKHTLAVSPLLSSLLKPASFDLQLKVIS